MRSISLIAAIIAASFLTSGTAHSQSASKLGRVAGADGKPFVIKVSRVGLAPEIELFGCPYFLTRGAPGSKPPLWYLDGGVAKPVTYSVKGKGFANFEVVTSGGMFFLTYVVDGVNEFWQLSDGAAAQVTLDDKPFSQRARLGRGGSTACLYQGEFDGRVSLFSVRDAKATAVAIADKQDRGTLSFAWQVGEQLLCAFYFAGTYDFHAFSDGKFSAAWEHNGEQEYESQVDTITEFRVGERLFLNVVRRGKHGGVWYFDAGRLKRLISGGNQPDWSATPPTINSRGAHFIAARKGGNGVFLADAGGGAAEVMLDGKPLNALSLACAGGGVLVRGEKSAWLLSETKVLALPAAAYDWIFSIGDVDILRRADGTLERYRDGEPLAGEFTPSGMPADFGAPRASWNTNGGTYVLEYAATEEPLYRLWFISSQ